MKITDIKVYEVRGRQWPQVPWIFVEVHTDEGITGIGEAAPRGPAIQGIKAVAPSLIGENPFQVELLWESLFRGANPVKTEGRAGLSRATKLGEICGIEIALWDIIGKSLGVPIYDLLGGRFHDRLRMYVKRADADSRDPEVWGENFAHWADKGFTALKIGIPAPRSLGGEIAVEDLQLFVDIVKAVKRAVGTKADVGVDLESKWSVASALRLVRSLDQFDLMWIENPVPRIHGFLSGLQPIKAAMRSPLCLGLIDDSGRHGAREILESRIADIIEPDLTFGAGGILEMKKIGILSETFNIPIAPHNNYGPIATMAAVHASATMSNFLAIETYPELDVDDCKESVWSERLFTEPIPIKSGYIELTDKPGLGVELSKSAFGKYIFEVP